MKLPGAVAIITGAAGGIGAALARRFAAGDAREVVVCDLDGAAATAVAREVGGTAEQVDVADAAAISEIVERTVSRAGRVDVFCANAGVTTELGLDAPDETWRRALDVNLMSHVYAARAVVPHMVAAGGGHFVATASAAGLLTAPSDAPYTASKHAAVGFAEWLAVSYGDQGIGVSVVCPLGVATPMLMRPLEQGGTSARVVAASGRIASPDEVADAVATGIEDGTFLILPHPEVAEYWARKAADPQRWLRGMRRLVAGQTG